MNKVILANFAATISSLSAGISIVATRFVIFETDPISLAFYRYFIASICLLPCLILGLKKQHISIHHIFPIIILGILLYTLFPWFFSASLKYTTAAYGAIALATMPIFTLIISCLLKNEKLTKTKAIGVALAFLGVTIVASQSPMGSAANSNNFLGIFLMLASALCAAIYSNLSKPLIIIYGPVLFTALSITAGMFILFPFACFGDTFSITPEFSKAGWIAVLFLGAIGGALQFTGYTWALKWLTPPQAAIYLTLTPISAIILAYPIVNEQITLDIVIGLVFVIVAIFVLNFTRIKK